MVALIVLASILAVMMAALGWFYYHSTRPEWSDSETRKAVLRMLIVIGPIFGMHYRPPRAEPPTIASPGPEDVPGIPGLVLPPPAPGGDEPAR